MGQHWCAAQLWSNPLKVKARLSLKCIFSSAPSARPQELGTVDCPFIQALLLPPGTQKQAETRQEPSFWAAELTSKGAELLLFPWPGLWKVPWVSSNSIDLSYLQSKISTDLRHCKQRFDLIKPKLSYPKQVLHKSSKCSFKWLWNPSSRYY